MKTDDAVKSWRKILAELARVQTVSMKVKCILHKLDAEQHCVALPSCSFRVPGSSLSSVFCSYGVLHVFPMFVWVACSVGCGAIEKHSSYFAKGVKVVVLTG